MGFNKILFPQALFRHRLFRFIGFTTTPRRGHVGIVSYMTRVAYFNDSRVFDELNSKTVLRLRERVDELNTDARL